MSETTKQENLSSYDFIEVAAEHSGCGRSAQVDQMTFTLMPDEKLIRVRVRKAPPRAAQAESVSPSISQEIQQTELKLPELPKTLGVVKVFDPLYTADQMREYALAALAQHKESAA